MKFRHSSGDLVAMRSFERLPVSSRLLNDSKITSMFGKCAHSSEWAFIFLRSGQQTQGFDAENYLLAKVVQMAQVWAGMVL
jgi:hypothetical protein